MNIRPPIVLLLLLAIALFASSSAAQQLPSSIRGYSVHRITEKIHSADEQSDSTGPTVTIGPPDIVSLTLTDTTIEAGAEIRGLEQEGEVDFLTFKDIVANGIPLNIEEYAHGFKLKKGEKVVLPFPVRGTVSSLVMARAAYEESTAPKDKWQVTGTVFVFGRFKKMGLTFKRVIPVPVTLTIDNPIRSIAAAAKAR